MMSHWFLALSPVLGIIAMAMSATHLLPIAVAHIYDDGQELNFVASMLLNFAVGALLWLLTRRHKRELTLREGTLLVVAVWAGGALFAAVPLQLCIAGLSFSDGYFEAASMLTATGATVLGPPDALPPSVNIWRAELQWLGGMGVIVLVVAVLPMLGVGGRQVSKAEIPGPMKEEQLTPRITQTAKGLWLIYGALTVTCMAAYHLAGMSWFDAVVHGLSTVSLGGFSSHEASIGHFNSPAVEVVAIVFMLLGALNFATHFVAWRRRSLGAYARDPEAYSFAGVIIASVVLVTVILWSAGTYANMESAARHGGFYVVSIATTTAFAAADYAHWPAFVPLWVLFLGTFVSCSGSTGGGIKMLRAVILYQQVYRELKKLVHPRAAMPLKVGQQVVPNQVIFSVLAYFFVWTAVMVSLTLLLSWSGVDAMTAFSAIVGCLNNIGPGLPSTDLATLTAPQRWICCFAMVLGRLELFALLVVFTPAFWRK
jgi:trk system potassium uptake protein